MNHIIGFEMPKQIPFSQWQSSCPNQKIKSGGIKYGIENL